MYLFVAGTMFAFTACGGGDTATEETATEAATEVAVCANTGEPCLDDHSCCVVKEEAEAVGCQVEGGTCLEDHSCCAPAAEGVEEEVVEDDHSHEIEGHDHSHE